MADKTRGEEGGEAGGAGGGDINTPFPLPRITIKFCTQCKWMLRAAYYAQELLSTFSTSLGEVALQPSTGGTFIVEIFHPSPSSSSSTSTTTKIQSRTLWDRKTDGGFPETKELKRRVRDVIDPSRDLGHVDRNHAKPTPVPASESEGPEKARGGSDNTVPVAAAGGVGGVKEEVEKKKEEGEKVCQDKEVCEDCN